MTISQGVRPTAPEEVARPARAASSYLREHHALMVANAGLKPVCLPLGRISIRRKTYFDDGHQVCLQKEPALSQHSANDHRFFTPEGRVPAFAFV